MDDQQQTLEKATELAELVTSKTAKATKAFELFNDELEQLAIDDILPIEAITLFKEKHLNHYRKLLKGAVIHEYRKTN